MPQTPVAKELTEIGDGLYAYVQGDGSWGWSNSGLITSQGESLLVDTLFTGALTEDMLGAYRRATRAADSIDVLVNTHANGDHTFGNHLVGGARIVGSTACAQEMEERPAGAFQEIVSNWRDHGATGEFMHETMGTQFDFSDIRHTPPTDLFNGRKTVQVGDRTVELYEVGPAHTRGDILVHLPNAKVVYSGDIIFSDGHPILWAGPVENWIEACERILGWDVDVVVPGHGPVGDKTAVKEMRDYLVHIRDAAKAMFDAGLSWQEAAYQVGYDAFDSWLDRERVVANVANIFRDLSGGTINPGREQIMHQMLRYRRGARCPHDEPCGCTHHGGDH